MTALPILVPQSVSAALPDPRLRVISNGKGVQSVTMILLAARGLIGPMPDAIIDAVLDDERTSSAENMAWLQSPNMGITMPFVSSPIGEIQGDLCGLIDGWIERMANPPFFVRNADGSRGILGRGCTRDYKLRAIWRECRKLLSLEPRSPTPRAPVVEMWLGITRDEKHRMAPSAQRWIQNRYPLIEIGWTRADCERWLLDEYGMQLGHSGCRMCPYRSDEEWLEMQERHPADFASAVEIDQLIRTGLPGVDGELFLHDSLQPLGEIDFAKLVTERRGGLLGWAGCSSGVCGI